MDAGRRFRVAIGALTLVVLFAHAAWADTTLDSSTSLSTNAALPTTVSIGANAFTIRLWAQGGNIPASKDGHVTVATTYTMATSGAITAGATTTTLVFPSINYNACPSTGSVPQGCPASPFIVNATLNVASGTPGNTTGNLTVATTTASDSGVTNDATPAVGRVRVIVPNGPPTVSSISGATTHDEGASDTYSVTAVDPDGDALTYAWSVLSGNASISGSSTQSSAALAFGDGPSSVGLQVVVNDGNGHPVTRSLTVSVGNVAPSAVFTAPATVNEGAAIGLALTSVSDPSTADTSAGFTYAFDCGDGAGFGAFGSVTSASCSTYDNGSRTVKGRVRDKDGGFNEYTASVVVANVAPTATLAVTSPVDEGSAFDLSFTAPVDASTVDAAAGFTYAFDCGDGAGFGAFGAAATISCATDDNGVRAVKARIRDKDGGATEYAASVTVDNVAPTAVFSAPTSVDEGSAISITLGNPTDPSSTDVAAGFTYAFDCGDGNGLATFGTAPSANCPTSDNASRAVAGSIRDKDLGTSNYTASVAVDNVAPSASFHASTPVAEGDSIELSLDGVSDPSSADVAAGFTYAFDCGDGFGPYGSEASASCATNDNGTRVVGGRIRDKDGGVSEYTATVTIENVAPTATFTGPASVDEGSPIVVAFAGVTDPSGADVSAGFTYAFDCGDGSGFGSWTTDDNATCATTDNGSRPITGRVRDKDGGMSEYTAAVMIDNVAPVATLDAPSTVDEGGAIAVSFTGPSDPSSDDTAAGFQYAFDCGDGSGYAAYSTATSTTCATDDNGTRTVKGRVRDKDGGATEYSAAMTVTNVAPVATLTAPGAVDEGSSISLALIDPSDPSSADTTAGFTYAFDCGDGGGFGSFGPSNAASCGTDDNGTRAVKARIGDKDGGITEYTAVVDVTNVAPVATFAADGTVDEGSPFTLQLGNASDPSSVDTTAGFTYAFDCGDGVGFGSFGSSSSISCATDDNGTRAVKGRIRDKDGGTTEYGTTVTVQSVAPTATLAAPSPVEEGSAIDLSLSDPHDPSSADVNAGFTYAFDCGSGFGSYGSANSTGCATDDNGTVTLHARIRDKDGATTEYGAIVSVDNVAPTAVFEAPATIDEGSAIGLALSSPHDPSNADTTAGFTYAFDCGTGGGAGPFSSTSTTSCPTDDNGSRTVGGTIRDKDAGATSYGSTVAVQNVAPSASFHAPATIDEGDAFTVSLSDASDPSTVDATVGFTYAFDCGAGTGFGAWTSTDHAACATNDNGSRTVRGRIRDKDGGVSDYSASVTIRNVDPVAAFTASSPVSEGDAITVSLNSVLDPSSADTAAGFTYAFDCGDGAGFGAYGSTSTATCATNDNGSRVVRGKVRDKDNGETSYSVAVDITNVPPTATLGAPASVDEGSSFSVTLNGGADVSTADTSAGLTYAFDCGDGTGFGPYGSAHSQSCATTDDDHRTVRGRVRDKDGGVNEYSAAVTVVNVAPTIRDLAIAAPAGTACVSNTVTVAFTVTDPASQAADPITGAITWGDGTSTPISGRTVSMTHAYGAGVYSLTVSVQDGDGGTASGGGTNNVALRYSTSGLQQPINMDGSSTFKLGSTIPTKVKVVDCTGAAVATATLEVRLTKVGATSSAVNEVVSSSAADNGNIMRYDGTGQYIFNLSTKRSQFNAGNDLVAGRYRMDIVGATIATITVEFNLRA